MDARNNDFDFDFTPIGQAIKKARTTMGMTRDELARIVDYDPRHLQAIENEGQYGNIVWSVIAQSHREICLCIGINQQDFFTLLHQTYTQIDRCGCFSDTTFLVSQSNYFAI